MTTFNPNVFDSVMGAVLAELEAEAASDAAAVAEAPFPQYAADPLGFGLKVLGEQYTEDVARIFESVRDNPVTVARSANSTGKTHGAARIAVWFYKCFTGAQVYTTSAPPLSNLARLLWGEIGSLVRAHRGVFAGDKVRHLNIQRDARSFITGVAIPAAGSSEEREARFSGKHAPHMLFVVDEGDAVPPEVYKGIEACLSGGHARLLVMFNPRGQAGSVYRMERDGQANVVELSALRHPNVVTGKDVIPGAVSRDKTVQRINEWSRPLVASELDAKLSETEAFEVPAFLVGASARAKNGQMTPPLPAGRRRITNGALCYMVLGIYPGQSERALINRQWLDDARRRWDAWVQLYGEVPPRVLDAEGKPTNDYQRPVMGLDVAEFGNDQCVETLRYGGWVPRPEKWGQTDPDATATRAAADFKEARCTVAHVDGTGVGAGVAPAMIRQDAFAISVKVASSPTIKTELGEFSMLRDQLWWSCAAWLRDDPTAMLPPDEELLEELAIVTYDIKRGKIVVMGKDVMKEVLKRSPDTADSLCLTFNTDSAQVWI